MARIGVFCLPVPSHVNLFVALAHALKARAHQITFFGISSYAERIRREGFLFELLEPDSVPSGTLDRMMHDMGTLGNLRSMRLQLSFDKLRYEGILNKGPAMVEKACLDALVIDQAEACGGSVADVTGRPWVSVCSGLCLNSEKCVPPFFTGWSYNEAWWALARNRLGYAGIKVGSFSAARLVNRYRRMWGLAPLACFDDTFSPLAQISQQIREFDFPRRNIPASFHYVGPINLPAPQHVDFPWEQLDGRPLVYASLGTLANRHERLYRIILSACTQLDVQLVLSLGGAGSKYASLDAPSNVVIVDFAPQRELLRRAALMITHGGLNSTLESLAEGVPLVAIPITFEQPGISARIRWSGAGEFVPSSKVTAEGLRDLVRQVLTKPSYRASAQRMSNVLARSGGAHEAAGLIEDVMRRGTAKPVSDPPAAKLEAQCTIPSA